VVRAVAPEALDRLVPSLVLQPLVENAIRHAIAPRAAGGTLTIGAQCDGEALVLSVANDGPAGDAPPPTRGTGVGLDALRRRLAARHGSRATMEAGVAPSGGFTVSLRLPA
jgi:LytS/YehU family sensor histidine kinase